MKKDIVGHCPYCTKVLFKEASFKDEADFETRCPYCSKPIMVSVEKKFVVIVKPLISVQLSEKPKDPCGKPC